MILDLLTTTASIINIVTGCVFMFYFLNIKKHIQRINMDVEELLQGVSNDTDESKQDIKKERLSAIIVGGNSSKYLGHQYQLTDLDSMSLETIDKIYCRYEARLGASMTKTLGNSFINLYVLGLSQFLAIADPPMLINDLQEDPFINHALTSTCCELYYRYVMYLAPFTAVLTTARHVGFNKTIDANKNGRDDDNTSGTCQESEACGSRDKNSCKKEG